MIRKVIGVGSFRVEWRADKATLSELTCRSKDGWEDTDFHRRGKAHVANSIHNHIQEAVAACNLEAMAEVDDTSDVASLLALLTQ